LGFSWLEKRKRKRVRNMIVKEMVVKLKEIKNPIYAMAVGFKIEHPNKEFLKTLRDKIKELKTAATATNTFIKADVEERKGKYYVKIIAQGILPVVLAILYMFFQSFYGASPSDVEVT